MFTKNFTKGISVCILLLLIKAGKCCCHRQRGNTQLHSDHEQKAHVKKRLCSITNHYGTYSTLCSTNSCFALVVVFSGKKKNKIFSLLILYPQGVLLRTPCFSNRVSLLICFRSDITAILLCTLSFLWSCCNCVQSLLDPQPSMVPFPTIHSLCCCLLTTLVRGAF